ncbi:GntR family transcriptional regulator [Microbispora rosea]|uniref:GntR family transcriptional regulator n=1 Tax=Microbispora rosea TaxID=58117 RepID=UPI0036D1E2F5
MAYIRDFSPGERLPGERELAERFNASRTTVRLALSALKSQGLIGSGQGQGTYVRKCRPIRVLAMARDSRARRADNHAATFNAEMARQERIGRQGIVGVGPVPATEVARRTGRNRPSRQAARDASKRRALSTWGQLLSA